MRVKVCGVTSAEDRDAVVRAGADAVGVICDVPVDTPREITPDRARDLVAGVPPFVTSVLVTMPETVADARELVAHVQPDALQVHACGPETVARLREELPVKVVAAVDPTDADLRAYAAAADALLVDSVDAQGAGGTGEPHDWERTRDLVADLAVPVVLAGGLTPENVADAVRTVRPFGVDVASGVEASGGVKDHDAVQRFVAAARRAAVEEAVA